MPGTKSGDVEAVNTTLNPGMGIQARRPVAGYIRVSRIGGRSGEGYISPDEQRIQIQRYAQEIGAFIPDDGWSDDQDYSGGNFDRPGWERILRRIESGELCGVIVLRVDRFARNVPDGAAQIRHIVDECNALFGSAQERMDPTTDTGRYVLQQFLNNAELQLNMLKSSWKVAKERAIARGAHIGPTPLGYGRISKGEERAGTLFPLAAWEPMIRELFRLASEGNGNRLIAKRLCEKYERPDGRSWSPTTVGHVIANRVYLGEVSYRPRTESFTPLVNTEAHEPMIDEATWLMAQRTPGVKLMSTDNRIGLLAGLIRCAGCRYRMSRSRAAGNVRTYRCSKHHGGGTCPTPSAILAEPIERYLLDQVQEQWQARFAVTIQSPTSPASAKEISKRLAEARSEMQAFACDLEARRMLGEQYHAAMQVRADAVAAAEAEWTALDAQRVKERAEKLSWGSLTHDELREVLGGAVDAVYIRAGRNMAVEDRAHILWAGELDDDAPARGKAVTVFRPFEWPEDDRTGVRVTAA